MIKTFEEYKQKGFPEGYLRRLDHIDMELARRLTDDRMDWEEYANWDGGTIQGLHPADTIDTPLGIFGIYETIQRHSKYEPFTYLGQCYQGGGRNINPEKGRRIYVCSRCRARNASEFMRNMKDVKNACAEIAKAGDIPVAPHLYFTEFLCEEVPRERYFGRMAGMMALKHCDAVRVIIRDEIISEGMEAELLVTANRLGIPVDFENITTEKR